MSSLKIFSLFWINSANQNQEQNQQVFQIVLDHAKKYTVGKD